MRWFGLLTSVLALLAGCNSTPLSTPASSTSASSTSASSSGQGNAPAVAPAQTLGGLPVPAGSVLRADESLIIGAGENWVGRAVLDLGRDADGAYRFFIDGLSAQGWTMVSAVRGRQSFLVFTRQERTLTIEMNEPLLGSTSARLTMAPRNATVIAPRKP